MRVKLSDIAKYSKGVQINGDDLIADGEYIYLNGGINPSGRWNAANVSKNTVTISEGGNSSGYINYITEPFWCGAHCYYLYDGPENTRYLYYALKSQQERLFAIRSGACMPNIKKADLGNFEFEYDFDEKRQNDIVNCLDKVQRIIKARQQEVQKLDDLIKARFVEMFGNTNLNEKGWLTVPLFGTLEQGASVSYGIVQTEDDVSDGIPVFRPIDIASGHIPHKNELKRTAKSISDKYKRTLLKGYELLITVRGSVGETFQISNEFEGCNVGRNIVPLRFNTDLVRYSFMEHFFNQEGTKQVLKSMTKGVALQGINMSEFREMAVIVPPIEIQDKFCCFANQLNKSKFVKPLQLLYNLQRLITNREVSP